MGDDVSHEAFRALVELQDGSDVTAALYRVIRERFGPEVCHAVCGARNEAPLEGSSAEMTAYVHKVLDRLEAIVGARDVRAALSVCLHELPEENYEWERRAFQEAADIDEFLRMRKERFLGQLEACRGEDRLFYTQEVDQSVIDLVRGDPEMGGGRREGNVVFGTKIPYLTREYLATEDPTLRRYYACHCPVAREAIVSGEVSLNESLCSCSSGFYGRPFEMAFGHPVRVEVVESVIAGDDRCRFAVHLPEEAIE